MSVSLIFFLDELIESQNLENTMLYMYVLKRPKQYTVVHVHLYSFRYALHPSIWMKSLKCKYSVKLTMFKGA